VRLLQSLALAIAIGAWAVILVGGFTTATNSGAGCRDVITCGANPMGPGAALVEATHRIVAWAEGFLVLAMLVLVIRRHRDWTIVRNLTVLAFVLIVVQATLGILSVAATFGDLGLGTLYPVFVTAHLGTAAAFLAVAVMNASVIFREQPPALAAVAAVPPRDATDAG